jgi:ADP-ribose pyrophosphatase YjhB (NUDIX family)
MSDTNYSNTLPEWKLYNVAQGILTFGRKILLVGNDYGRDELVWSLPGGRLEPGEQHEEALVREFLEETGLQVKAGELLYVMDSRTELERRHFITCVFEVELANPTTTEVEPEATFANDATVKALQWVEFEQAAQFLKYPSLGEGAIYHLYYGKNNMPRRYFRYPEYQIANQGRLSWPPK